LAHHLGGNFELGGDGVFMGAGHARGAAPHQLRRPKAREHDELKRADIRWSSNKHCIPFTYDDGDTPSPQ
jgi:hypothetical protein